MSERTDPEEERTPVFLAWNSTEHPPPCSPSWCKIETLHPVSHQVFVGYAIFWRGRWIDAGQSQHVEDGWELMEIERPPRRWRPEDKHVEWADEIMAWMLQEDCSLDTHSHEDGHGWPELLRADHKLQIVRDSAPDLLKALERASQALRFADTPEAAGVHFRDLVKELEVVLKAAKGGGSK